MNPSRNNDTRFSISSIVEPEEVGFSSERIGRIQPAMQQYIDRKDIQGVVTLVARHGRVMHFEAQGLMDVEANIAMSKDTIFRICSTTKPITSVATLILYEEGRLQLDDPIARYLPTFRNQRVAPLIELPGEHPWGSPIARGGRSARAIREVNIRDCLTHTAGLAGVRMATAVQGRPIVTSETQLATPGPTVEELLERWAQAPLSYQPGTVWDYGMGIDIVGVVIEVITGKPLEEFLKEKIFKPLGMPDSFFNLPQEKASRLAILYEPDQANNWQISRVSNPNCRGGNLPAMGGGGLLSTVPDYARFAQMLLNRGVLGNVRILGRKTVELMTTNHIGNLPVNLMASGYNIGSGYGFGLGVSVRTDLAAPLTLGSVGTYGWGGAFLLWYFADPKENMFGLLFSQVKNHQQNPRIMIQQEFERLVYQALID